MMIDIELQDTDFVIESLGKIKWFYVFPKRGGSKEVSKERFIELISKHKEVDVVVKGTSIGYVA